MSNHIFTSVSPSAGAMVSLYTVPFGKRATLRVICTNRGVSASATVAVTPDGIPYAARYDIVSGQTLLETTSITTAPLMLTSGDTIRVVSNSDDMNFHCTGLLQDED